MLRIPRQLACVAALLGVALILGCEQPAPVPKKPRVLGEQHFAEAYSGPQRAVGQPCEQGPAQCASGVCLKTAPGPGVEGLRCSQTCTSNSDCTAIVDAVPWQCVVVNPRDNARACVPQSP